MKATMKTLLVVALLVSMAALPAGADAPIVLGSDPDRFEDGIEVAERMLNSIVWEP